MALRGLFVHASWLFFALAIVGCGTGQTGSPDCAVALSCVCQSLRTRAAVRATVVSIDESAHRAQLSVDESFGFALLPDGGAGMQIDGSYTLGSPCDTQPSVSAPAVGSEVFAAFDAVSPSNMWLLPWSTSLRLSDTDSIAVSDLARLTGPGACPSYFPIEQPSCDDTDESIGCAMRQGELGGGMWCAGLFAMLLLARRLRKRSLRANRS